MPDVASIVSATANGSEGPAIKLSCVLTEDNVDEIESYVQTAAETGVKRVAVRQVFDARSPRQEALSPELFERLEPVRYHSNNPVYEVDGVEVTYWTFDETTGKSLNLFANGLLSDEYLLSKAPGVADTNACQPHSSRTEEARFDKVMGESLLRTQG